MVLHGSGLLSFVKMSGESLFRIMVIRYHSEPDMEGQEQPQEIIGELAQTLAPLGQRRHGLCLAIARWIFTGKTVLALLLVRLKVEP